MKKIFIILCINLLAITGGGNFINAQNIGDYQIVEGEYTYYYRITNLEPKECEIYSFQDPGEQKELVIPSEVNGYTVTSIDDRTFWNCSNFIGTITIPNTVRTIGIEAFKGCHGFTSLILNEGLEDIAYEAFSGCQFTNVVTIPCTVRTIGEYAFYETLITGLVFEDSNEHPSQLESIDKYAFYNCDHISGSISLPSKLSSIGKYSFGGTNEKETYTLTLPKSLTTIGVSAFDGSGITGTLTIPNTVTSIGEYAFASSRINSLIFEEGSQLSNIGNRAFWQCTSLTGTLTIPSSVESIGNRAFNGCTALTGLSFEDTKSSPSQLEYIDENAFLDCSEITGELTLPNSLKSIGVQAFQNCEKISGKLIIPNGLTSIGDFAFYNTNISDAFFYSTTQTEMGTYVLQYANIYIPTLDSWNTLNDCWNEYSEYITKMPTYTAEGWVGADGNAIDAPESTDHVAINADYIVADGKTLNVNSFGFCGDGTTLNGSITVKDGCQLITNGAHGNITIEKEITGYAEDVKWHTISSPLKNDIELDALDINSTTNLLNGTYDLYRYDEPTYTWHNYKNNSVNNFTDIESGRGYLYANAETTTLEFTGEINTNAISYSTLNFSGEKFTGFNLIGNPYTHDIYMGNAIKTLPIQRIIFALEDQYGDTWNEAALELSFSNGDAAKSLTIDDSDIKNQEIALDLTPGVTVNVKFISGNYNSECAFTIKYIDEEIINDTYAELGSLNDVTEDTELFSFTVKGDINDKYIVDGYYKLTGEGAWAANPSTSATAIKAGEGLLVKALKEGKLPIYNDASAPVALRNSTSEGMLEINVANEKYNDKVFVSFDNGIGLDKISHQNENIPLLYIPTAEADMAIAMIDKNVKEIPVNFEAKTIGEYTISLRQENCHFEELYLLDKQNSSKVNILEEDYTFIASTHDNPERFVLMLNQDATEEENFVSVDSGELIISGEATINIYDALGRCIFSNECKDATCRLSTDNFNTGVYIIRRIDSKGTKTQKIIL